MLASLASPYPAIDNPPPKFWLWPNLLSLDAPFVAVVWQILFIRCFHVSADALPAILLVASVWLIYAADRALDAWRGECGSPRHRFYRAHWRILLPVWMVVLGASAWLALTELPGALLLRGLALLAAVVVYLAMVHGGMPKNWGRHFFRFRKPSSPRVHRTKKTACPFRVCPFLRQKRRGGPRWAKEAVVGLLFALGASLAAWTNVRTAADAAAIALFFALCWINCAAIQKWEAAPSTFSMDWPVGPAAIGVALVAIALLWMHRPVLGGAEMASAFAFVLLDRSGRRFSPDALRVLADVALLSPMVFLPLAGIV